MTFREPWFAVDGEVADRLRDEALAEIGPDHELHGLELRTVAKCGGCDDVVFSVSDETWAIVHLSWSGQRPEPAPWPRTQRFGGFIAIEAGMDQHEH